VVTEAAQGRRRTALEWCELYDYGCVWCLGLFFLLRRGMALKNVIPLRSYTSLGSTYNTFPNPLLRSTASGTLVDGGADTLPLGGWRPAWELEDEEAERAGRRVTPRARTHEIPHSLLTE
jgi:FAD synthetase